MSFFDDLKRVLLTFLGLLTDAAKVSWEYLTHYFAFLRRMVKLYLLWVVASPLVIVLPALLLQLPWNWLYSGYVALIGIGAVCLTALAFPLLFAAELLFSQFPKFRENIYKTSRHIADVGFWAAMLAVYFYIVPIWKNPSALPLVILTAIALALAVATGRVVVNPRWVQTIRTVQLFSLLVFSAFAFIFPKTAQTLLDHESSLDPVIAESLSAEPKALTVTSAAEIEFVNRKSGRPVVWYHLSPDGGYELYDAKGFHPSGSVLRLAESDQEKAAITAYFRGRELAQHEASLRMEAGKREHSEKKRRQDEVELEAKTQADAKAEKEAEAKARREARAKAEAELKAKSELAAQARVEAEFQKREYILRYLFSTNSFKAPDKIALAIGVANSDGRADGLLTARLVALFPVANVKANGNLFTPAFAADGVMQKLLGSDAAELSRLGLPALTDYLLLVTYQIQFSTNPQLENIITAKLQLNGGILKSDSGEMLEKLELEVSGAGFTNASAEAAAKERLVKSLSTRRWQLLSQ